MLQLQRKLFGGIIFFNCRTDDVVARRNFTGCFVAKLFENSSRTFRTYNTYCRLARKSCPHFECAEQAHAKAAPQIVHCSTKAPVPIRLQSNVYYASQALATYAE